MPRLAKPPDPPQLSRREISELLLRMRGEEITPEGWAAYLHSFEPIIAYIHFGGQRWRNPKKLTRNQISTVGQRVHVLTYMLNPNDLGFHTHTEMGRYLGISKSLVMRHVADFNAAFGVYGSSQKKVSVHGDIGGDAGVYVEAGKRGHETRRRRAAERLAASPRTPPATPRRFLNT